MRRLLSALALAIVVLLVVLLARTFTRGSHQLPAQAVPSAVLPPDAVKVDAAVARLAEAVRLRTVSSHDAGSVDPAPFHELHALLQRSFPKVHAALRREAVNGLSLIYTWPGSEPSLPPIVLMAHQDVVPVNEGTEPAWEHPPFDGVIADGYLWGRGTMDTKHSLMASLEAAELLLGQGFTPKRTVMLVFGHDEEVGGTAGLASVARLLDKRGVRPEMVLDEGLVLTEGIIPGVSAPVATVGIAEKGYLTLKLEVAGGEGHSSMPTRETTVGILAGAIAALERERFDPNWSTVTTQMFDWTGPESALGMRVVSANLWLLRPIVERVLAAKATTDATQRTTTAPTMLSGSSQDNVLAKVATAHVNFRIVPGETRDSVEARVREVIDDARVQVTRSGGFSSDPAPVSSVTSPAFQALHGAIRAIFPDAVVTPALVLGATDSRHLAPLAADIYRFAPLRLGPGDAARIHGTNERIAVANYGEIIRFYAQLIANAAAR